MKFLVFMLPKRYKLRKNNEIKKVFEKGKYSQKGAIGIKFLRNNLSVTRFAFMVGLKISKKATQRNKIRRRLNEIIRLNLSQIKKGYDVMVMTKPEISGKEYQETEKELMGLFKKNNLCQF